MFVVFDSADGTGKSSLIKELASRSNKVKTFFDPGISHDDEYIKWQDIRNFIKQQDMASNTETLMFFALRAELMRAIVNAEEIGFTCLCDRFDVSTHIYQGVIKGRAQLITDLEKSISFRKPDFTFILSAPFDVITERIENRFKTENANMDKFKASKDFRYKVWQEYEKYADENKHVTKIDANRSIEDIADEVQGILQL